jgi:hypothetical protein
MKVEQMIPMIAVCYQKAVTGMVHPLVESMV